MANTQLQMFAERTKSNNSLYRNAQAQLANIEEQLDRVTPTFPDKAFIVICLWKQYRENEGGSFTTDLLMLALRHPIVYDLLNELMQKSEQKQELDSCEEVLIEAVALYAPATKTTNWLDAALAEVLANNTSNEADLATLAQFGSTTAYYMISDKVISEATNEPLAKARERFKIFQHLSDTMLKTGGFEPLIRLKLLEMQVCLLMKTDPALTIELVKEYQEYGYIVSASTITIAFNTFINSLQKSPSDPTGYFLNITNAALENFKTNLEVWAAQQAQKHYASQHNCAQTLRLRA